MTPPLRLGDAPFEQPLTVLEVPDDPTMRRRLSALGLRRGAQVSLVQRLAGGGRVVSVAGARVALGRPVLADVLVEGAAA